LKLLPAVPVPFSIPPISLPQLPSRHPPILVLAYPFAFFLLLLQRGLFLQDSGRCFFTFLNKVVVRSRLSALRPTPSDPGEPIGLLLSLSLHHRLVWHGRPYQ
jgi:hypothetical protein